MRIDRLFLKFVFLFNPLLVVDLVGGKRNEHGHDRRHRARLGGAARLHRRRCCRHVSPKAAIGSAARGRVSVVLCLANR
jgi:hypothetical protein